MTKFGCQLISELLISFGNLFFDGRNEFCKEFIHLLDMAAMRALHKAGSVSLERLLRIGKQCAAGFGNMCHHQTPVIIVAGNSYQIAFDHSLDESSRIASGAQ